MNVLNTYKSVRNTYFTQVCCIVEVSYTLWYGLYWFVKPHTFSAQFNKFSRILYLYV